MQSHALTSVRTLKIPSIGSHTFVRTHENTDTLLGMGSAAQHGKMEKTGCKIICGAPTTLAVKGLMMMMMMMLSAAFAAAVALPR